MLCFVRYKFSKKFEFRMFFRYFVMLEDTFVGPFITRLYLYKSFISGHTLQPGLQKFHYGRQV